MQRWNANVRGLHSSVCEWKETHPCIMDVVGRWQWKYVFIHVRVNITKQCNERDASSLHCSQLNMWTGVSKSSNYVLFMSHQPVLIPTALYTEAVPPPACHTDAPFSVCRGHAGLSTPLHCKTVHGDCLKCRGEGHEKNITARRLFTENRVNLNSCPFLLEPGLHVTSPE